MEQVKKVIVPTDFSVKSLSVIKEIMDSSTENEVFEIILLHGIHPPTSITDLLFMQPAKYVRQMETPEFKQASEVIKSKYQSRIRAMYIDLITSEHRSYFRTYTEKNKVSEIYIPVGVNLNFSGKHSFDIIPLLRKSKLTITEVQLGAENFDLKFNNDVTDLFLSHDSAIS